MKIHQILSSSWSRDDMEASLLDMEKKFDVYITLHDHLDCFVLPDGSLILPEHRHVHSCPYCKAGRTRDSEWNMILCPRDCFQVADTVAVREAQPFTKTCWKGVFELVIPIMRGESVAFVICIGGWCGKIPEDTDLAAKYLQMHRKLPDIPSCETLEKLINTFSVFGRGLLSRTEALSNKDNKEMGRREIIIHFITENFHRPVKLDDLAKHLYLSPSRTCHIVNQLFDMSFKQLLTRERMIRARKLLLANWPDMNAVAEAVGYGNVYYFNTAFKKYFGTPPGRFKKDNSW